VLPASVGPRRLSVVSWPSTCGTSTFCLPAIPSAATSPTPICCQACRPGGPLEEVLQDGAPALVYWVVVLGHLFMSSKDIHAPRPQPPAEGGRVMHPLGPLAPMTRHATVYSEPAWMRRKNATHVMAKGS